MPNSKHAITHKIILQAELESISPLRIANGKGDTADLILLRNHEGKPYIPASSIAGAIRARWNLRDWENPPSGKTADAFWGTETHLETPGNISQSHFRVFDLESKVIQGAVVRDGVRIDPETGTVEDSKKYDYEVLDPGGEFTFRAEVTLRAGMDLNAMLKMVAWVREVLHDDLQVGGNTSKGFGRLKCTKWEAWHFDFSEKAAQKAWFDYCANDCLKDAPVLHFQAEHRPRLKAPLDLVLQAEFALASSLIIGGPGDLDTKAKKSHLRSNGLPVISGSSLMGALRHRAGRILQLAGVDQPTDKINHLFGYQGDDGDEEKIQRSRIETREAVVNAPSARQVRIRVDRFTQAPEEGGLFDSAPIWKVHGKQGAGRMSLWWRIRGYQPGEAALLLHLLRDLWTGDLPLGGEKNIGRGRLEGVSAEVQMTYPAGESPGDTRKTSAVVLTQEGKKLHCADPDGILPRLNSPLSNLYSQQL